MATYAPLSSPTPSTAPSIDDIPLLPRHRGTHNSHPYSPPVSPRTSTKLPPHLRPTLTLDTSHSSYHHHRPSNTSPPLLPPQPTSAPPLPSNAHSSALAGLRGRVEAIHSASATAPLVASPVSSHHHRTSPAGGGAKGETDIFFAHLAEIRTLGGEVGQLHARMEGVGVGWARAGDGEEGSPKTDREGKSDGVLKEGEGEAKTTTQEFDDTALMFEKRQASIEAIMGKLATLSTSLSMFHALPTPSLGFASKRAQTGATTVNSTTNTPSPTPQTPPPPPGKGRETFAQGLRREAARQQEEREGRRGLGISGGM